MHSRIFQVSSKPISEDEWITDADAFNDRLMDYCKVVDSPKERDESIGWLVESVPQGVFSREGDILTLIDIKPLLSRWKEEIADAYAAMTAHGLINWYHRYMLEDALRRPICSLLFFIEDEDSAAQTSDQLVEWIATRLNPGDKIHIGSVLDYHF